MTKEELEFHLGGMLVCPPVTKDDDGEEMTDYTQLIKDIIQLFDDYSKNEPLEDKK